MSVKKEDRKHPYMHLFNWTDGKLCFWRDNKLYSKKSKEYFEESIKRWVKDEKNFSALNKEIS